MCRDMDGAYFRHHTGHMSSNGMSYKCFKCLPNSYLLKGTTFVVHQFYPWLTTIPFCILNNTFIRNALQCGHGHGGRSHGTQTISAQRSAAWTLHRYNLSTPNIPMCASLISCVHLLQITDAYHGHVCKL
jgi:hypothetical protein